MSTQVKIIIAAINIACLAVTLAFPTDATPFILLVTIASVIPWAFSTQGKKETVPKPLLLYTSLASFAAFLCIVLGTTTSCVHGKPESNNYFLIFKDGIASLSKFTFNYLYFAVPIFFLIVFLIIGEVIATLIKSKKQNNKNDENRPIAITIDQRLKKVGRNN